MMLTSKSSRVERVKLKDLTNEVSLFVKREDELHPFISGNKYRKLKYNLKEAIEQKKDTLITFGGAYSNHIAATAAAGAEYNFKTVGVIRGDELDLKSEIELLKNPTLKFAAEYGMKFEFVSRHDYRLKNSPEFLTRLTKKYKNFYLVPEGGTNQFAVKGCEEILTKEDQKFDYICCAVGTGGTISGIINSSSEFQKVIGFPALKGDFLKEEVKRYVLRTQNWSLNNEFHFGGYAKVNAALIQFINNFKMESGIPLDPIYTGKMMFGIMSLIQKGYFKKGSKILAIHTGGLQGIQGMNSLLEKRKLPIIN